MLHSSYFTEMHNLLYTVLSCKSRFLSAFSFNYAPHDNLDLDFNYDVNGKNEMHIL